ncbi:hypothetical protein BBBOND_0301740 [Babesia bigemina]|uniref:Uncharacterized protein n=1 Tax=Babesia bigemina TaxID=5866 RepID=A0A061DDH4_BABBI|nr:hypothetical protein BBBOND_0301740 [Babesia bigemina]CDR96270.1 hypothetical protein BBBOND_0301740 [Babesia bigemina]|eukprot:XP_012768456.1 hypothetical protein BBBOND_0301740 [Babesia bigemina]
MEPDVSDTVLHFDFENDDVCAITGHHLIFICGPRDLVLRDALQRHLNSLDGTIQAQGFPWTPPFH